ncbi:hypothetical protein LV779_00915 [Streptomyces thinghirensis]|nr:hypothetical protein [Streptomyces thinghirensis]
MDLAQFREMEAFAAFGSDLDAASKAQLERGQRMVELLKQDQYQPMSTEDQAVSVWAGTTGKMDEVPVADIRRFEKELLEYLHRQEQGLMTSIREGAKMSDDTCRPSPRRSRHSRSSSRPRTAGCSARTPRPPPSDVRKGPDSWEPSSGSTSVASDPSPRPRRSPRRWR